MFLFFRRMQIFKYKNKLTASRIAIISMLLALMIALKYSLGFVPGIEVITFMFIFLGIFLPSLDLLLLISAFNFSIMIIYGFGTWWIMYWIIWPIDAFASKLLSKFTKKRFAFALLGFLAGFLVFFWYFWSDLIFFGWNFALLNVITAIPINLIEGFTTLFIFILVAPTLAQVFNHYSVAFWKTKESWNFKPIKNSKINIAIAVFIILICITSITVLFIYNQWFFDLKQSLTDSSNGLQGDGDVGDFAPTNLFVYA